MINPIPRKNLANNVSAKMSLYFKFLHVATSHFLSFNILSLSCHNTVLIVWLELGRKITWLGSGKHFYTVPRFPYKISSGVELTKC